MGVLPIELQLACEPDPLVNVDAVELAMEVFVSELKVRVSGSFSGTAKTFVFATGLCGGVEMRELCKLAK